MSIGIVGLGYVGLPLAVAFAEAGEDVVGVDLDSRKVAGIRAGRSYIEDIPDARLRGVDGRIHATSRFVELHECEAILICVPTPLTRNREPDLGALAGGRDPAWADGDPGVDDVPGHDARAHGAAAGGVRAAGGAGLRVGVLT